MSHISKCPKVTDVLSYWEASGEISEPSYKSLLYFSSIGSYCILYMYMYMYMYIYIYAYMHMYISICIIIS